MAYNNLMIVTSLLLGAAMLSSAGVAQNQKQPNTLKAKQLVAFLEESDLRVQIAEVSSGQVRVSDVDGKGWLGLITFNQMLLIRGDDDPPIHFELQSRFQTSTLPDRAVIDDWVKAGNWDGVDAYPQMNRVVEIRRRFRPIESLIGFAKEIQKFRSLVLDLQVRLSGKSIDPLKWTSDGSLIPDSTILVGLSGQELSALIHQWKWEWRPDPSNKVKGQENSLRGARSLGMATEDATISNIEVTLWANHLRPSETYGISAKIPVDDGGNPRAIVKAIPGSIFEQFDSEAFSASLEKHGFYENYNVGPHHYSLSRTMRIRERYTVGQLREDIAAFAKRVDGLPRR